MARWKIDPDHSVAAFSVRHMMIARIRGQLNRIAGEFQFDPVRPGEASAEISIEVNSLTTGIRKRDEHLMSGDFFDAGKYPLITFRSASVELTGANSAKVRGDLTIRGVTRPVTLEAEYFGPVKSPFGETSVGFRAETVINREDFGMTWNRPMEAGGVMLGTDVEIVLDIEADLVEE